MKHVKLAAIAITIIATMASARGREKLDTYWFKASDDSSLGSIITHNSGVYVMMSYLETHVAGLDFNNIGAGTLYANGYITDSPYGIPDQFIYATYE
jgi:hypothetical protein